MVGCKDPRGGGTWRDGTLLSEGFVWSIEVFTEDGVSYWRFYKE